jgi:myo-inositol-1(or 4)-monophosphatase
VTFPPSPDPSPPDARPATTTPATTTPATTTPVASTPAASTADAASPLGPALSADDAFGPLPPGELLSDLSRAALRAAQAAAALLADAVGRPRELVELKSSATDMVSEVDRGAEALVTAVLAELRPDDGLFGEEGASKVGTTGVRWVVDPLDGTTNFLFGIPQFSVSIAAEIDEVPVVGVVIDPSRGETWAARKAGGARCNGVPCHVAHRRSTLSTALVATGFGYRPERRAWQARVVAQIIPVVRDIRRFGSAALDLCWVAGGRVDAYYEWGLNPWDLSAGRVICTEAGAQVDILAGHTILATTPTLAGPLAELLGSVGGLTPPDGGEPQLW